MHDADSKSIRKKTFYAYLKQHGLRNTVERTAVLDLIISSENHFTAEELFKRVASSAQHVCRATVYNTIKLLQDSQILSSVSVNGTAVYYLSSRKSQIFLVCDSCGKVKSAKNESFESIVQTMKFNAFTSAEFTLCIKGICSTCSRKLKKRLSKY